MENVVKKKVMFVRVRTAPSRKRKEEKGREGKGREGKEGRE